MPDPAFKMWPEWKETFWYAEGERKFAFECGWGASPPVLYVPSAERWDAAVPDWLRGRRDEVVARLVAHSGHRVEEG